MMFIIETFLLGLTNLGLHKLRSLLTVLGIIFGVASVITMVAIGEGNKRKALADIQRLGARNIIVRSVKPPEPAEAGSSSSRSMLVSYGLLRKDLRRIQDTVHPIDAIIPLKRVGSRVTLGQRRATATVFGTVPGLMEAARLRIARGRYLIAEDMDGADHPVAVLGAQVAARLFPLDDPLENWIRIDDQVFKVVGVMRPVGLSGGAGTALVGRDLNYDVHVPMPVAEERFGDMVIRRSSGSMEAESVELSELYIQVPTIEQVFSVAEQVKLLLDADHAKAGDVTVIVPLELIEQAERTQRMFNTLMVAIASISLLVGGIGIMNIMLATVTERTREIGIRRALGATRLHIILQFLVETTVLSGLGGLIGVAVGLAASAAVALLRHWFTALEPPHVVPLSVFVSFIVATAVGVIFGLYPAIQAARQDPIVALRHD